MVEIPNSSAFNAQEHNHVNSLLYNGVIHSEENKLKPMFYTFSALLNSSQTAENLSRKLYLHVILHIRMFNYTFQDM